jgi:hypothetical protein
MVILQGSRFGSGVVVVIERPASVEQELDGGLGTFGHPIDDASRR